MSLTGKLIFVACILIVTAPLLARMIRAAIRREPLDKGKTITPIPPSGPDTGGGVN